MSYNLSVFHFTLVLLYCSKKEKKKKKKKYIFLWTELCKTSWSRQDQDLLTWFGLEKKWVPQEGSADLTHYNLGWLLEAAMLSHNVYIKYNDIKIGFSDLFIS